MNYLVTIGILGYLKLVKLNMYPKFLKINLVVVVRHSASVGSRFNDEADIMERDACRARLRQLQIDGTIRFISVLTSDNRLTSLFKSIST